MESSSGWLLAWRTMADRGGAVNDRVYGSRNLYSCGTLGGRMDSSVTNAGIEWYGKNVVNRTAVLNSCILGGVSSEATS